MKSFKEFLKEDFHRRVMNILSHVPDEHAHDVEDKIKNAPSHKAHAVLTSLEKKYKVKKRRTTKPTAKQTKGGHLFKEEECLDIEFAQKSLQEEEQAIHDYTLRIAQAQCPELKKILSHALEEEKTHAKMLKGWLNK